MILAAMLAAGRGGASAHVEGRCEMTIPSKVIIQETEVCKITAEKDRITIKDSMGIYFVELFPSADSTWEAFWNRIPYFDHANVRIGTMKLEGSCWTAEKSHICIREEHPSGNPLVKRDTHPYTEMFPNVFPAKECLFKVGRKTVIDGRCKIGWLEEGNDGFYIDDGRGNYFAYVTPTWDGSIWGSWNGQKGASHAHESLGDLEHQGNCWVNQTVTICWSRQ
jgi:hypothetical protein